MRCPRMWPLSVATIPLVVAVVVVASPAWAQTARDGRDLARADLTTATLLLVLAGWLVYLGLWARYGRAARVGVGTPGDPPSLELPDDHPAVVDVMRRDGAARPSTLGTVVLDLARRGYLRIEERPADRHREEDEEDEEDGGEESDAVSWVFHRLEMPRGDLRPYENAVYTRLFASGSQTSQWELLAWVRANRQQARVWVERVGRAVSGELASKGYLEQGRRAPVVVNLATGAVVVIVSLLALAGGAWLGLVGLASGAYQVSLSGRLRRRTAAGSERAQEWSRVAEALVRVDEVPPRNGRRRVDWERCLVYAMALGVADEFLAALGRLDATVVSAPAFVDWYEAPDGDRLEGVSRFAEQFGRSLAAAAERDEESASGVAGVGRFSAWASRSR